MFAQADVAEMLGLNRAKSYERGSSSTKIAFLVMEDCKKKACRLIDELCILGKDTLPFASTKKAPWSTKDLLRDGAKLNLDRIRVYGRQRL